MAHRVDERFADIERKVERNTGLFVALDDRVGDLEEKVGVLEERQAQHWGRISEQMAQTAKTIENVTERLERISQTQQDFALRLERNHRQGD